MAVTTSTIADPLGTKLIIDANSDATSESNVTSSAAGTVYAVEIDNPNTSAVYTKLVQSTNPTVGTTAPDLQFKVPASSKQTYLVGGGFAVTGLSFWTVTSPYAATGNNSNATNSPSSAVKVKILCTF
tara:strand:+ start:513 stop:896 length:384 start_codon:yes stop_codon:yes gene_type:complete